MAAKCHETNGCAARQPTRPRGTRRGQGPVQTCSLRRFRDAERGPRRRFHFPVVVQVAAGSPAVGASVSGASVAGLPDGVCQTGARMPKVSRFMIASNTKRRAVKGVTRHVGPPQPFSLFLPLRCEWVSQERTGGGEGETSSWASLLLPPPHPPHPAPRSQSHHVPALCHPNRPASFHAGLEPHPGYSFLLPPRPGNPSGQGTRVASERRCQAPRCSAARRQDARLCWHKGSRLRACRLAAGEAARLL